MGKYLAAKIVPMGISVDSHFSHANWGAGMGGVSFPLLADFHPKGAVAASFGLYNEERGIANRSTVIVDAGGTIRHVSKVEPGGERDMNEMLELCKRVTADYSGDLTGLDAPAGVTGGTELFVKNNCAFSRATLLARDNLHAQGQVAVHNVNDEPGAMARLKELTGKEQAPCLVSGGEAMLESTDIVRHLVTHSTGFWSP